MVELEIINCKKHIEEYISLQNVPTGNYQYCGQSPLIEKSFFMEDEFCTFGNQANFFNDECFFRMISQVPLRDHIAWTIFSASNLELEFEGVHRNLINNNSYVFQNFSFKLLNGYDYGYFQLMCLPENVLWEDRLFCKYDILDFAVYRNRKIRNCTANPLVVLINPVLEFSYIPLIPEQCLQIVHPVEESITYENKYFFISLGNLKNEFYLLNNEYYSEVFKCKNIPNKIETITVNKHKNVCIPPLIKEDNKILAVIDDVHKCKFVIHAKNLDGIRLNNIGDNSWYWNSELCDLIDKKNELTIYLNKDVDSLCVEYCDEAWSIFECSDDTQIGKI